MANYRKLGDSIFNVINYTFFLLFAFICFYPFYYILIYSLSDPTQATIKGVLFLPVDMTFVNFMLLFQRPDLYNAFFVSASRVILGATLSVFCTSFFAFLLTQKELPFRKVIYRLTVFLLYVSAGLIPFYITLKMLGLLNNYLVYLVPYAVNSFYLILVKTYIEQLPASLEESAMIDGAGHFAIYSRVIFPLSKPIIATIAIFLAVDQWNAWQDNLYYVSKSSLQTLQLMLFNYLNSNLAQAITRKQTGAAVAQVLTPASIKMTICMITILPIVIVYPSMQRYFIKGILIGAVKG